MKNAIFLLYLTLLLLQSCTKNAGPVDNGNVETKVQKQWKPPVNPCFQIIDPTTLTPQGSFVPKSEDECPFVEVIPSGEDSIIWAIHHTKKNDTMIYVRREGYWERTFDDKGWDCTEHHHEMAKDGMILRYSRCKSWLGEQETGADCGEFLVSLSIFEPNHIAIYAFEDCDTVPNITSNGFEQILALTKFAFHRSDQYFWRNLDTLFSCDLGTYYPYGKLDPTELQDTLIHAVEWPEEDLLSQYIYWGKE